MANKYAYRVHVDHPVVGQDCITVVARDADEAIIQAKKVYAKRFNNTKRVPDFEFKSDDTFTIAVERGWQIEG